MSKFTVITNQSFHYLNIKKMSKSSSSKTKSSSCKCKTINLAREGLTPEERKCKMLVYEKRHCEEPPAVCRPPFELGLREAPKSAKRIRVCTAQDMKTTCPPVMCTCPSLADKQQMTMWLLIKKGISFGIRSAIVAGVVWWTWKIGVWGNAKTTECLYVDMRNTIIDKDETCDEYQSGRPRTEQLIHKSREKWNQFVSCAFNCSMDFAHKFSSKLKPDQECELPETDDSVKNTKQSL